MRQIDFRIFVGIGNKTKKKKNWEILGKWELGAIGKGGLKEDYKIVI